MQHFYSAHDATNVNDLLKKIAQIKANPTARLDIAKDKCIVLLFFNPSLRTKLSTQKAALNIGMQVINMDMNDSWAWELEDEATMDLNTAEHIKEAARVISGYADIIAIRSFPGLKDKEADYQDRLIRTFMRYATKPILNMESAIRHPLQSLTDLFTIREHKGDGPLNVVLSWAPHPRALPQAVSNSFLEWMHHADISVTVTHPEGYELHESFMNGHQVEYDQQKALSGADVVYVKNWSSYKDYGQILNTSPKWMMTKDKLDLTNDAILMHCLPVRRNVVISDDAIDSDQSIVIKQAENRLFTAQAVIQELLNI